MSVEIKSYNDELRERFEKEAERIRGVLGEDVTIEHVGSSAVGIGGKNIVDVLVGVKSGKEVVRDGLLAADSVEMLTARDSLYEIGYREGHDSHPDRIFMMWRDNAEARAVNDETGAGDFHVHICVAGSEEYVKMLAFRDYLRANREAALEYERMKSVFAREAGYDRQKYKELKSGYVGRMIREMCEGQVATCLIK